MSHFLFDQPFLVVLSGFHNDGGCHCVLEVGTVCWRLSLEVGTVCWRLALCAEGWHCVLEVGTVY